jgi:hypothetical protein
MYDNYLWPRKVTVQSAAGNLKDRNYRIIITSLSKVHSKKFIINAIKFMNILGMRLKIANIDILLNPIFEYQIKSAVYLRLSLWLIK